MIELLNAWLRSIAAPIVSSVEAIGEVVIFGARSFGTIARYGVERGALVDQLYVIGVRSVGTTMVTGFFVGAILSIQIDLQLQDFGAQGYLGGLSASVIIRNVGPVLIAFILSGKVGAYTSAELATMQVTDQMSALRCLGADPIRYLVAPRLMAVVASSFLLLILGLMTAIGGGVLISSVQLNVNPLAFVSNIPRIVSWWSVGVGTLKSLVFGAVIGIVSCYRGYHTRGGAAEVGLAVKATAVQTMVAIIVLDFVVSSFAQAWVEWMLVVD